MGASAFCGGVTGCIGGAVTGALVEGSLGVGTMIAGCVGGAVGATLNNLCRSAFGLRDWCWTWCDIAMAVVSAVAGCLGGTSDGGKSDTVFAALGINITTWGAQCTS